MMVDDRAWRQRSRRWRRSAHVVFAAAAGIVALIAASPASADACSDLAALRLPDTVIKSAELVPAGGTPALGLRASSGMPAFCRVVASVRTAPDSDVGLEVWLPQNAWTGVFHGNGNGGFGGVLSGGYRAMEAGVRRGYASAVTDTGTAPATPLEGDALIGHQRKWRDWGRLSTHAMTVAGKAITQAYYREPVRRAYYTGCSTGGQEGLIEALYYPQDYDGVLVGAPVINRTWGHAAVLWDNLAAARSPAHGLSDAKLELLHGAVLSACAGQGGGLADDPFLTDPRACRFDPARLSCKGADTAQCLTPAEVETARAFYSGPRDANGQQRFFGWPLGSEAPNRFGWNFLQSRPGGAPPFSSLFKWVFGPDWTAADFDVARDMPKVDAALGPIVNDATGGDLSAFRARGGKLIVYHGWSDSLVPPQQTLAFYDRVVRNAGGLAQAQGFARVFMAPGVSHCAGGQGPDVFNAANGGANLPPSAFAEDDLFTALADWVDGGPAPAQVIATAYVEGDPAKGVAMRRPLCAHPAKAWYGGRGDPRDPRSFVCSVRQPERGARQPLLLRRLIRP